MIPKIMCFNSINIFGVLSHLEFNQKCFCMKYRTGKEKQVTEPVWWEGVNPELRASESQEAGEKGGGEGSQSAVL